MSTVNHMNLLQYTNCNGIVKYHAEHVLKNGQREPALVESESYERALKQSNRIAKILGVKCFDKTSRSALFTGETA